MVLVRYYVKFDLRICLQIYLSILFLILSTLWNLLANSFDVCFAGEVQENRGTWRERLKKWNEILQKEKLAEQLDSANSKYVVEFDMKEVENSLRKDVVEKVTETQGTRALWIAKRWWMYRPRLPYTYFLQKLDCSEVTSFSPLFYLFFVFLLVYRFSGSLLFGLALSMRSLYASVGFHGRVYIIWVSLVSKRVSSMTK